MFSRIITSTASSCSSHTSPYFFAKSSVSISESAASTPSSSRCASLSALKKPPSAPVSPATNSPFPFSFSFFIIKARLISLYHGSGNTKMRRRRVPVKHSSRRRWRDAHPLSTTAHAHSFPASYSPTSQICSRYAPKSVPSGVTAGSSMAARVFPSDETATFWTGPLVCLERRMFPVFASKACAPWTL